MNNLIKSLIVVVLLIFTSCSKNHEGELYSSLGADVDKARLEAASQSLITNIGELSESRFAQLSVNLLDMTKNYTDNSNKKVVYSIASLGVAMVNEESICKHFNGIENITTSGDGGLSSLWQDGKGTWEWDSQVQDFIKTSESQDEIIYKLPSSKTSESNDLIIRIYDFEVFDGDFPGKGEVLDDGTVVTEMISSLFFEMKVQNELVATSNINVDVSTQGQIENVVITFNPLPFSFQVEAVNNSAYSKWRYSFLNDSKVVFEHLLFAEVLAGLNSMMIQNANSSIQISDIKLIAKVEGNGFVKDIALLEMTDVSGETWAKSMATLVNKHVDMKVRYVADGAILAQGVAYATNTDFGGGDEWYVNFLLRFNDGSELKAEDYFEDNLALFETEFENFMCKVEDQ